VISRLRKKMNTEFEELYGSRLGFDAVIENLRGKGGTASTRRYVLSPQIN